MFARFRRPFPSVITLGMALCHHGGAAWAAVSESATPLSSTSIFRFQRELIPDAGRAGQPACAALDASVFAYAAPALRDLRLFQDGMEVPFVIEESFDEHALASGTTTNSDRSLYRTAATGDLHASSNGAVTGTTVLPSHAPVERVTFLPEPSLSWHVDASASPLHSGSSGMETVSGSVDANSPHLFFTVGANLQAAARVDVRVSGEGALPSRFSLEMRRRSLCYIPRSSSRLVLYMGGPPDVAPAIYKLSMPPGVANAEGALLGPVEINPGYRERAKRKIFAGLPPWYLAALALSALVFLNSFRLLLRFHKAGVRGS